MLENKPVIAYPTRWKYKIIMDATQKKSKIDEILANEEYKVAFSKFSNGGKYMSFEAEVLVASDEHRVKIFDALKQNFKFVL